MQGAAGGCPGAWWAQLVLTPAPHSQKWIGLPGPLHGSAAAGAGPAGQVTSWPEDGLWATSLSFVKQALGLEGILGEGQGTFSPQIQKSSLQGEA